MGRGARLTFAGRYPPADPVKRSRFLAERDWWLKWRKSVTAYWACDCQENFYKHLRQMIALDADDYDDRIEDLLKGWERTTMSEPN